jgi:leader peptidase (prepilin peptidase) / N-methyltransferase
MTPLLATVSPPAQAVWVLAPDGPSAVRAVVLACVLAAVGVPAGVAARRLLRRLRRGARVPPPWCEAGVAVAWAATGAVVGATALRMAWLPVLLALGWLAVPAAVIDVLHHRLPDALTLPALPVALVLLVPLGSAAVLRGVAGAAVAVAAHAVVCLVARDALGAGDVKLAAPLGCVLAAVSWPAVVVAGVLAALLSGGLAVAVLVRRELFHRRQGRRGWGGRGRSGRGRSRRGWSSALPHGPSMLAATWLVVLAAAGTGGRGP